MTNTNDQFVPLYQRLFDQYRQDILTQKYSPGGKIDSINEIQKRYGVSRETAKQVLQKLAESGLIIKKPGKGSFVLSLGSTRPRWAIIVPFFSAQVDEIIHTLKSEAQAGDRQLRHFISYNNWQEEIRLVGTVINERYEAIIVIPTFDETKTAAFYRHLQPGRTVVTLLDHTMAGSYFTYVIQSYDLGIRRGVQYLLSKSNGNIAFIKNNVWLGPNMIQNFMEQSFTNFVLESGARRAIIIDNIRSLSKEWIEENNITGFFSSDDTDAVRILGRLKEWQYKVPDNISLVSYGNTEIAKFFTPPITSIDPHTQLMVQQTVEIIERRKKNQDVSFCQYVLQPEIIIRNT
jgi:DNA-binding LacI/PurR family transcriptional regulator